jgi:hypothetical protein
MYDQRRDGEGHEQVNGSGNRADVRARVHSVGDDKAGDHRVKQRFGIVIAQHSGQPHARPHPDLSADVLDCGHHGEGEGRRPERREAERRARHGVGADARGVIIRRAGDETGA